MSIRIRIRMCDISIRYCRVTAQDYFTGILDLKGIGYDKIGWPLLYLESALLNIPHHVFMMSLIGASTYFQELAVSPQSLHLNATQRKHIMKHQEQNQKEE